MAKSLTPSYVAAALANDRTAQLQTLAAVTVWMFVGAKNDNVPTAPAETIFKSAPHRSLKTWQNYVSACSALAANVTVGIKLESLHAAALPENYVAAFGDFLASQLKAKGYQLSSEDVANYAKGRPSMKAKLAAEKQAEKDAKLAQDKADAEAKAAAPTITPEQQAETAQQQADEAARLASIAAEKAAQSDPTPTTDESAPLPAAIKTPITVLFSVTRRDDTLDVAVDDSMTRDEMLQIMLTLESLIAETAPALTFPVLETETA